MSATLAPYARPCFIRSKDANKAYDTDAIPTHTIECMHSSHYGHNRALLLWLPLLPCDAPALIACPHWSLCRKLQGLRGPTEARVPPGHDGTRARRARDTASPQAYTRRAPPHNLALPMDAPCLHLCKTPLSHPLSSL